MGEAEQVSALIGDIYDASLDPALWPVAIGKIVDLRTDQAAALADTLDGLTAAMFLVDDDGRIVQQTGSRHACGWVNDQRSWWQADFR